MKALLIFALWFATTVLQSLASELNSNALKEIAANYKSCITEELKASINEDGSLDEVFFLEGKAHCDTIQKLEMRKALSEVRISKITSDLVEEAKQELGLK